MCFLFLLLFLFSSSPTSTLLLLFYFVGHGLRRNGFGDSRLYIHTSYNGIHKACLIIFKGGYCGCHLSSSFSRYILRQIAQVRGGIYV